MGGLIQLVAYGEQDVFLTGDPKVTFFQAVYKRHTNFAIECIQQTVNGSSVTNGARMSVVVARSGDLIGEMYIDLQTGTPGANVVSGYSNAASTWDGTAWMAERAIKDVELTIGGQKIDMHYQRWWRLYSQLYMPENKRTLYGKMTSNPNAQSSNVLNASAGQVMLPLLFFFNRNPGLYLPLIALQYHEVRLDFDISNEFSTYFNPSYFNVWGNYVFLDTEERRMFAQKGHEYLIEQVQYTGAAPLVAAVTNQNLTRITYNHPVKELVWCITQNSSLGKQLWDFTNNATVPNTVLLSTTPILANTYSSNINGGSAFNASVSATANTIGLISNTYVQPNFLVPITYSTGSPMQLFTSSQPRQYQWIEDGYGAGTSYGPLAQFKLVINGQDRMKINSGKYFNQIEPYNRHSGNPYPGIYSYSFALKPEEHQPSGTCNFSRIDNSQAVVVLKQGVPAGSFLEMFAINYNVLRIQSGMGGLAFSN
jgi:hypothetical protein